MAYYYGPDGSKIPVDDHSPQGEKDLAAAQWRKDHPQPGDPAPISAVLSTPTIPSVQQIEASRAAAAEAAARADREAPFNYGGYEGGAARTAGYFDDQARAAQGRPGERIDYSQAGIDRENARSIRGMQGLAADQMWKRAQGLVPSVAEMEADRQMRQAAAEQSSAAASARGPAGLALAQQGAAANTAAAQSNISGQAQVNAARERMAAEQAAFGAFSGMRSGDYQGQGLNAEMAQKQAALNAAQRASNDAYSMGLYGYGVDVNKAQLGAQGNKMALANGARISQNQLEQADAQHSQDRFDKYLGYGLGAAGTAAGVVGMALLGGGSKQDNPDMGAGGYTGNAPADGSLNSNTSGGSYGQGTYGVEPPDNPSDVTAKQNIAPLGGMLAPPYGQMQQPQAPQPYQGPQYGYGMMSDTRAKQDAHALELEQTRAAAMATGARMQEQAATQHNALMGMGPAVGGDPVTAKFAEGLAPSSYEYRPGIPGATPGRKVGPMAQNMASNDITGTAIRENPNSGLLGIDNADGLKVALGASGHLAKKQQITDAEIARLKAIAAQMQAGNAAQGQGLMSQGPSVRRISGGTRANGYNTELTDGAELAYQRYAQKQFPNGMNDDYDLRGAFAGNVEQSGNGHYPDTYKKPNHETFSDESQYAADSPETAGHWDGERYTPRGPARWLREEMDRPRVSVGQQYLDHVRGYQ